MTLLLPSSNKEKKILFVDDKLLLSWFEINSYSICKLGKKMMNAKQAQMFCNILCYCNFIFTCNSRVNWRTNKF